ncbi:uncharacterized protein LOC124497128 isoform X1 [Dermatophagoides farinae]|uniref:uncharacterized protein LOC124497128 isoform X1 n=2 Tax=Dermatophagoides farinae TaxID=6954 RepID=UPI003F61866A
MKMKTRSNKQNQTRSFIVDRLWSNNNNDHYQHNNNNHHHHQYCYGHRFYMAIIFTNLLVCTIVYYVTITSICRIDNQSSSLQQRSSKFKHFVFDHHPFYGHQQQQQQQQHHKSYDDDQRPLLSNYVQISGYLKTNLDVLYDYYNENRIHQHQKQSQQSLNYYDQSSKIKKMMIIDENFLTEWYRLMYALIERLDDVDENDIKHLRWQRQNKLKNLIWTKIDQLQNPKKHLIKMDANTSSSSSNNNNNNSINHHHHEIKHNNDFDNNNNNNNREKQSLPHETTTTNNCKSINKIVCDAYKSCGFGCFVHHMAYCLIAALALNRTLILYPSIENFDFSDEISSSSKNNHYYQRLFKSFKSINSICDINSSDGGGGGDGGPQQQKSPSNDWMSNAVNINDVINHKQNQKLKTIDRNNNNDDDDDNIELIYLPIIENLDNRAKFRPMAIPEQLRKHLEQLTRMPFVVFLGSIISYIMRLNDEFERKFLQYRQRIKFRINDDDNDDDEIFIGIHVRRTDKLFGEGEYYPLSDYMKIVQRIYDRIDIQDAMMMMEKNKKIKKRERKIYLATDDITVWQNEVPQYIKQGYRFYGDSQITKSASPGQRNTAESFDGFIMDVLSLSYTDYLVCTFSSQVCRLAYELMQVQRTNGRDMSTNFYSLDDVYYFGGQISHRLESIMANHHPPPYVHNGNNDKINNSQKQHKFNVGDSLGIEKNLHNGYYLGDLYETKIQRLLDRSLAYPIFKVIEKIDSTSFKAFE